MSAVLPPQGLFGADRDRPQFQGGSGKGKGPGLALVLGLHVLLAWALASGLARDVIEVVRHPTMMAVIDEPPPPPPPPKLEPLRQQPHENTPPPPAYVPPPELVPVQAPPAPIQAIQHEVAREQPPAPAPAPVVAAPVEPPKAEPARQDVSVACPGYERVLTPAMEEAFDRVRIPGQVHSQLRLRGGQIVEAQILSGPKEYTKYLQSAARRIRCSAAGADEVLVQLELNFAK